MPEACASLSGEGAPVKSQVLAACIAEKIDDARMACKGMLVQENDELKNLLVASYQRTLDLVAKRTEAVCKMESDFLRLKTENRLLRSKLSGSDMQPPATSREAPLASCDMAEIGIPWETASLVGGRSNGIPLLTCNAKLDGAASKLSFAGSFEAHWRPSSHDIDLDHPAAIPIDLQPEDPAPAQVFVSRESLKAGDEGKKSVAGSDTESGQVADDHEIEGVNEAPSRVPGNALQGNETFKLLACWATRNAAGSRMRMMPSDDLTSRENGSYHAEDEEEEQLENKRFDVTTKEDSSGIMRHFVIHPYAWYRSMWDVLSLTLVLYDMFMIPMGFFELSETPFLKTMTWTTRLFWTGDMPMSIFSGYVCMDGSIELRFGDIIKKYLKTWFILDILVVGVDWLEYLMSNIGEGLGFARMGKATRIFRILRMIRLLRLARMKEVLELLQERVNSEKLVIVMDLMKLMIIMTGSGHLMACVFYEIGNNGRQTSWVTYYEYDHQPVLDRYVMAFRWSLSQFAGGMDEVVPQSLAEGVFSIFVSMASYWAGAVFLGILTSSMTQLYLLSSQHAQQLTVLRRYLNSHGISKKLAMRVQRNAQHAMTEKQKAMPEVAVEMIQLVSEPLRKELHFEMYSPLMQHHPFFRAYIVEMPDVMRKVCHSAMSLGQISLGDVIFSVGETDSNPKMYFVNSGRLLYTSIGGVCTELEPGRWISEAVLWVNWVHRGRLKVREDGQLYMLDAKGFQQIVTQFEHMGFDPRHYAEKFVQHLNNSEEEMSDLPSAAFLNAASKLQGAAVRQVTKFFNFKEGERVSVKNPEVLELGNEAEGDEEATVGLIGIEGFYQEDLRNGASEDACDEPAQQTGVLPLEDASFADIQDACDEPAQQTGVLPLEDASFADIQAPNTSRDYQLQSRDVSRKSARSFQSDSSVGSRQQWRSSRECKAGAQLSQARIEHPHCHPALVPISEALQKPPYCNSSLVPLRVPDAPFGTSMTWL